MSRNFIFKDYTGFCQLSRELGGFKRAFLNARLKDRFRRMYTTNASGEGIISDYSPEPLSTKSFPFINTVLFRELKEVNIRPVSNSFVQTQVYLVEVADTERRGTKYIVLNSIKISG